MRQSEKLLKAHLVRPKGRYVCFYDDNGVDNYDDISSYLLLANCYQEKQYARIND